MAIAAGRGLYNLHKSVSRASDGAARYCRLPHRAGLLLWSAKLRSGIEASLVGRVEPGRSCDVNIHDIMDVVRVPSSDVAVPSIAPVRPVRGRPGRPEMVGWYRPVQLVRTALSIATSSIIGRNVDQRELEALHERTLDYFDYSLDDAGQPPGAPARRAAPWGSTSPPPPAMASPRPTRWPARSRATRSTSPIRPAPRTPR